LWWRATCFGICIFAPTPGLPGAYEDRPSGRLIESQESGGRFESTVLRPKVTIHPGNGQVALRLHEDAHKKCSVANSVNFPVLLEPAIQHDSKA
jgi:organic hydroperoxide reductase OsmC/OhrA